MPPRQTITSCSSDLAAYPNLQSQVKVLQGGLCNNQRGIELAEYLLSECNRRMSPVFGVSKSLYYAFTLASQATYESGFKEGAVADWGGTGATGLFQLVFDGGLGNAFLRYGYTRSDATNGNKQIDFMIDHALKQGTATNTAITNAPSDGNGLPVIHSYVTRKLIVPWANYNPELMDKDEARRADWLVKNFNIPGYEGYIPLETVIQQAGGQPNNCG